MDKKKLFIVGVGPGDPELITLKAINALKESEFIFYPDVYGGKNKIAYYIIKDALKYVGKADYPEERLIPLEIEMKRSMGRNADLYKQNAGKIIEKLKEGNCSYATLGDPVFYSTYWGLYNAMGNNMGNAIDVEIINGVSSFNYSFGLLERPYIIKNASVLISVPVKKEASEIEDEIKFVSSKPAKPQIIVFMKAGGYVKEILSSFRKLCHNELKEGGLKLYLIEKSALIKDFEEKIDKMDAKFDYFSIFIGVFA